MPPIAAAMGSTALRRLASSPTSNSRFSSSPTTKKNRHHQSIIDPVMQGHFQFPVTSTNTHIGMNDMLVGVGIDAVGEHHGQEWPWPSTTDHWWPPGGETPRKAS